jgi:hypothetical protein
MTDDRRGIAVLLLVLQSGLDLLAALGLFTFARLSGATSYLAGPELIAFGGPLLLILCALGVVRGLRAARIAVYTWEAVTILGNVFSVLASAGNSLTLTLGLSGLALPVAVIVLLRQPSSLIARELRNSVIVGLLFTTALIHLALVPEHLSQPPELGGLFLLDAIALIAVVMAAARSSRWWRAPAAALLLANIVAYTFVVVSGNEGVDDLGIATKLIELVALGLVIQPRHVGFTWRWFFASASLVTTIVLSGGMAWAASMRPGADTGHHHGLSQLIAAAPPTDAQKAAAAKLVDDTRAGIARYEEVQVALTDGYRPSTPPMAPTVHYANPAYAKGPVLDPTHPQTLVYANTPSGPRLLGAMYMMPKANEAPRNFGGALAEWHTHPNLCFTMPPFAIDGLESPFATCPVGSINGPTPAMLHVWTVPNPAGPFGDLPPAYVERLTRGDA